MLPSLSRTVGDGLRIYSMQYSQQLLFHSSLLSNIDPTYTVELE